MSLRGLLIGMVHLLPLPGSPGWEGDLAQVTRRAVDDAQRLLEAGFTGLIMENMGDVPYLKGRVGPETVAAMTAIGSELRRLTQAPLGVQVLAGANREALAVALACGADFVRVEGFVFAHVADEGIIEGCAGDLLRYRARLGVKVQIAADIKKKHAAHAITADVSLAETAEAAEFFQADAVVVTGTRTGDPAPGEDVRAVKNAVSLPVLVGSGVTPENIGEYAVADSLIVGSWVKQGGDWRNPVDPVRAAELSAARR